MSVPLRLYGTVCRALERFEVVDEDVCSRGLEVLVAALDCHHHGAGGGSVEREVQLDLLRKLGAMDRAWKALECWGGSADWRVASAAISLLWALCDDSVAPSLRPFPRLRNLLHLVRNSHPGDIARRAVKLELRIWPKEAVEALRIPDLDFADRFERFEEEEKYPPCFKRFLQFLMNTYGEDAWRTIYKTFDYNGSGTLSNNEMEDALKKLKYPWPKDADEVFYWIDAHNEESDSLLKYEEFLLLQIAQQELGIKPIVKQSSGKKKRPKGKAKGKGK